MTAPVVNVAMQEAGVRARRAGCRDVLALADVTAFVARSSTGDRERRPAHLEDVVHVAGTGVAGDGLTAAQD